MSKTKKLDSLNSRLSQLIKDRHTKGTEEYKMAESDYRKLRDGLSLEIFELNKVPDWLNKD